MFTTLPNGLRLVALPMPWRQTVCLSVFVRAGSLHEPRRWAGISHVVEHMAFKGTPTRDCQRINLDAERLGADLNAHTDKDHTAFHIDGLARDLPAFVELLADIILHPAFPADEFERERQVILHELTEFDEDPAARAMQAFDRACYGAVHPAGRPVIGQRRAIERLTRADLLGHIRRHYGAANLVVSAAGPLDPQQLLRLVEQHFGALAPGEPSHVEPPTWQGGLHQYRMAGSAQCQIALGFESPRLHDDAHLAHVLAAAVLGEGMSSPLLDEIRERRGLAYFVACSADVLPLTSQFVIEAATSAPQAMAFFDEVHRLLHSLAAQPVPAVQLERARRQLQLRTLRQLDHPSRRLEAAAQDIFTFGAPRDPMQSLARLDALDARAVQDVFARLLTQPAAIGLAGQVPTRLRERAATLFLTPTA